MSEDAKKGKGNPSGVDDPQPQRDVPESAEPVRSNKVSEAEALEHLKLTGHNDKGYVDVTADPNTHEDVHFRPVASGPASDARGDGSGEDLDKGRPDLRAGRE